MFCNTYPSGVLGRIVGVMGGRCFCHQPRCHVHKGNSSCFCDLPAATSLIEKLNCKGSASPPTPKHKILQTLSETDNSILVAGC